MSDTGVPSLIIIGTAINQLETKVSQLPEAICCCLQTCNVLESKVMNGGKNMYTKSHCHRHHC